ncbi:MAG TPA: hypothetical protein PLM06_13405 [Anaerolineae bacterium]|nr:hypothetical protein [Anaerolineae bacterium]
MAKIDKNMLFAAVKYVELAGGPEFIIDDLQKLGLRVTIEEAVAAARTLALKETDNAGEDKTPDERDARLEEMKQLYDTLQNYTLTLLAAGMQYGLGLARLERDLLRQRSDSAEVVEEKGRPSMETTLGSAETEQQLSRIKAVLRFMLLDMEARAKFEGAYEFAGEIRGWLDWLSTGDHDHG